MAKGLTASKAKRILEDGTVRGKALTEKQKKFFGAVAGGATPLKKLNGGWLDKFGMGGSLPGASGMMYARTSGTSPEEPKRAQDGTVMYGTPEYKKAYEEGTFADIPNQLEEVVVTAGVDYEKYPLYDKLSAQQKEYFKDPGPIGRGVRRAAQTDRGLAEDTRDMVTGMLVKQPLAALQAPQSLMVEGIEALRGRDANFLNALTFDTQRLPSQTMGFEDKPGWDLGGSLNTTMDVVADPLNIVGVGLAKNAIKKFTTPLKNIGKYYRNPLGDAFKIGNDNPRIPTFLTRGQNPPNPLRSNPKMDADNFMQSWTNPNNPSFVSKFDDQILKPFPMASMNENYLKVKTRELNVLQQQLDDFVEATGSNVLPKAKSLQKSIDALTSEINMFYRPIRGNLARNNMKSIQAGEFNTVYSTTGVQPGSGGTYFVPSADQPMNTWKYMYPNKPNTRGVGNNSVVKIREVPVGATEAAKTKARTSEMLTGIHETLGHASNAGGAALTRQTNDLIKSALKPNLKIKEGTSKWVTDFIGPKATYKDWAKYLQEPTEMIARVMELRRQYINPKYWGTGKQYDIPDKLIDRIFRDGLSGKSKVNADFFRVIDKKGLKKLMKGLYATIPMAVGADGLLEYETPKYKDGGSTPKAQVGDKVASIASQMEANEEDGGRPPLGVVDHIRALFDEEGLCRDNTCVQTVKDFYSKAGIEAMPKDVYNNREFLKNFKEYGFEEILDQKNLQPGDVLQYYYGPDSEDVKEDPSYLNFPYHMGVYVNPGEYIGDGDSKAPIQRKNMYTGIKDGKEYKKDPFRAFRYIKQNKNGGWLSKYENGGVIEDDRGQWAHPGKVTKINSNNITMKGVNYPVLGVSDTGDKKMMQPGKDYKFNGNSVTEYPMAQEGAGVNKEGVKQYKWFKNYMRSPKYKERLKKEFPDYSDNQIGQEVKSRLENVMQTRVGFLPRSSEISTGVGDTQGVYDADEYPGAIMLRPEYSASTSDALFKPGNYLSGYNTIPLHEWSHAADDGGNRMPQSTTDLMLSKMKENSLGISKDKYYYTRPTEYLGRMQPLRYLMQQEGLYDAGTQDFTKEDLEKAKQNKTIKNNQHFQDLMKNVNSDEDFIELMNKVASVDNSRSEYPVAQDGLKTKAATPSFPYINRVPDTSPQVDFLKDWTNSTRGQELLSNSFDGDEKDIEKLTYKRINNLDNVDFSIDDHASDFLGRYNRNRHDIKLNSSLLDTSEPKLIGNQDKDVVLHELSHAQDFSPGAEFNRITIPFSDQKLINKYRKRTIKDTKKLDAPRNVRRDIKDRVNYIGDPTETRARLNSIRYFYETSPIGKEEGMPSIFDSEVTPDMMEVMKDNAQFRELQEVYDDEEILELLNTVSDNSKSSDPSNMAYAKEGESLVALDQLTNFTNYNTPQPGGWLDKY